MKKKTKLIFIFLAIFLVLAYFSINNSTGKTDSFLQIIKLSIPQNIKNILKETIFVFKNQKNLKKEISEISKKKINQIEKTFNNPVIYNQLINYFEPKNISELMDMRKYIIENFILDENQVSFTKINNLKDKFDSFKSKPENKFEIYKVKYYDLSHFAILEKTQTNNKKLLIYSQGHGGNPYNYPYFIEIKQKFKNEEKHNINRQCMGKSFPDKYNNKYK